MKCRSAVINYIERRFYKDDVGIAFLYCNYKERGIQTAQSLIGSLAQQLVQRYRDIPSDLEILYDNHSRNRQTPTPPTLPEYRILLKSQLVCCPTTFLVVDALDECDNKTRSELCDQLRNLPKSIHLLITSRHNPELEDQIQSSTRLEIRASNKDIEMYLEDRIEKKEYRLNRLTQKDPELRPLVINTIRDKSKEMYVDIDI
jgi:ankyrin repeat domain-containing protein 50